jgi:hypothetical protein
MLERKTRRRSITMRDRRSAIRRALEITTLALTLFMTSRAFAAQTVTVLYAGSLVGLMERSIGPAFRSNRPRMSFAVIRAAPRSSPKRSKRELFKATSLSAPIRK